AAVLAMLVAIGDTAAQVAQEEGAGTTTGAELTLLLTRVTTSTARAINDLIAEELDRRTAQYREVAKRMESEEGRFRLRPPRNPPGCASPAIRTSARSVRRTRTR